MKPVKFNECNLIIGKDQEEYLPLPAYLEPGENGQVVTCWELSEADLKRIQETKRVYVSTLTFHQPLQPIFLSASKDEIFVSPEED